MSPEEAAVLAAAMTPVEVADGEALLRRGEPNGALYALQSGRFRTTMEVGADTVVLGEAFPASFCGEAGLIDGGVSKVTVTATAPAVFLKLSDEALVKLRATQPRLVTLLLRVLCEDLAARLRTSRTVLRRAEGHTLQLLGTAPHEAAAGSEKGLLDSLKSLLGLGET